MEKVKTKSQKKKKRYITLRHISAGVAAAAVIAISFVALGEMDEPKEMELTNQFITSKVSDEPVQKDADKSTDHIPASEEKNVNKKTSQASKNTVIEENLQTEQQIPATASLDEETKIYKSATVTVTEDVRDEIFKILSDFEKDETGYIVDDIESVVEKLKEIGASVVMDSADANANNYIMIK